MTTPLDPLTLRHVRTLCAAIDAGGDDALLPLADALEEAGDPRAAGLRRLVRPCTLFHCRGCQVCGYGQSRREARLWNLPQRHGREWWCWTKTDGGGDVYRQIPEALFRRLRRCGHGVQYTGAMALYVTRSAALLALAQALAEAADA